MRFLKYKNVGEARIWSEFYIPSEWITKPCPTEVNINPQIHVATLELVAAFGPRIMYGLLGAKFEPDTTQQLSIEVGVSPSDGKVYQDNLIQPYDRDVVHIGLPLEYSRAILDGLTWDKKGLLLLGSGKLMIYCAAHGESGSCNYFFKNMAICLVKLLLSELDSLTDEEMSEILPQKYEH